MPPAFSSRVYDLARVKSQAVRAIVCAIWSIESDRATPVTQHDKHLRPSGGGGSSPPPRICAGSESSPQL